MDYKKTVLVRSIKIATGARQIDSCRLWWHRLTTPTNDLSNYISIQFFLNIFNTKFIFNCIHDKNIVPNNE